MDLRLNLLHEAISKLKKSDVINQDSSQASVNYLSTDWSCYINGTRDNQLYSPFGIAIQPISERIYICDYFGNKITVCNSEGKHLFSIRDPMAPNPFYAYCDHEFTFVLCSLKTVCIFTLDGEYITSTRLGVAPSSICRDTPPNSIAVCDHQNPILYFMSCSIHSIECLKLDIKHKMLQIWEGKKKNLYLIDIKIVDNGILILSSSHGCLLEFNHEGSFLRLIAKNEFLLMTRHFTIDHDQNIILSDNINNCIIIYQYYLDRKNMLGGKKILSSKQIYQPRGIAIDSFRRIIVASLKQKDCLQAFTYDHI